MTKDTRSDSPWAGAKPRTERPSRRERERLAQAVQRRPPSPSGAGDERRPPRGEAPRERGGTRPPAAADGAPTASREATSREQRLYGLNACLAAFARRPDALRKVYLVEARIGALKAVLAWCVQRRIGYRVVASEDLDRLTASRHHEGVCFDLLRPEPLALSALLDMQPSAPAASLLLWLDGVGNPHNLGALLRSAAHFGVGGVIVPAQAGLDVSGAAARVAEGAAEIVPLVQADDPRLALRELHARGYALAATVPRDGTPLFATTLPRRLVLVLGAEGEGMSDAMIGAADLRLTIPGSGAIESLNVAASVAVLLGEYWRQSHPG
ncbi:MAG TPA: TrmH family RNA methyltransferase [Dokdonella sp.]|nr:TrmH family RNA methyltransferase [Dokdonella sp.]